MAFDLLTPCKQSCGDILTKKKLDPHTNKCWNTTFTCLDCHTQFWNGNYKSHTVSEYNAGRTYTC